MTASAPAISRFLPFARTGADLGPRGRQAIGAIGIILSALMLYAIMRAAAGIAPFHSNVRNTAILLHMSAVIPAVPLGAYVIMARKGNALHRQLGKIWLGLMVATALSAIFIKTSGSFSWIHIFVPLTLHGCWQILDTARKGRIAEHKLHTVRLYVLALIIPGLFTLIPGRMMFSWLVG